MIWLWRNTPGDKANVSFFIIYFVITIYLIFIFNLQKIRLIVRIEDSVAQLRERMQADQEKAMEL